MLCVVCIYIFNILRGFLILSVFGGLSMLFRVIHENPHGPFFGTLFNHLLILSLFHTIFRQIIAPTHKTFAKPQFSETL